MLSRFSCDSLIFEPNTILFHTRTFSEIKLFQGIHNILLNCHFGRSLKFHLFINKNNFTYVRESNILFFEEIIISC